MPTRSLASRFESGSSIRNAAGSRMIARGPSRPAAAGRRKLPGPAVEQALETEQLATFWTRSSRSFLGVRRTRRP